MGTGTDMDMDVGMVMGRGMTFKHVKGVGKFAQYLMYYGLIKRHLSRKIRLPCWLPYVHPTNLLVS